MPRPCQDDHPQSPDACRLCWLWENDSRYRRLWSAGDPPPPPWPPRHRPCRFLGPEARTADGRPLTRDCGPG
jgi:hypothetical protein